MLPRAPSDARINSSTAIEVEKQGSPRILSSGPIYFYPARIHIVIAPKLGERLPPTTVIVSREQQSDRRHQRTECAQSGNEHGEAKPLEAVDDETAAQKYRGAAETRPRQNL